MFQELVFSFKKFRQNKFSVKQVPAEQISHRSKYFVTYAREPLCSHHELHTIVLDQYTNSMHGDHFFLHREIHAILRDRYTKPMYRICFFPHRELHTIVLDWKTKFMHGDYIFPIVSYIPLSQTGKQSPCMETNFSSS